MKQIFDWLRENIEANSIDCFGTDIISTNRAWTLINEAEAKWESEEKEKPFTVGIDVHKQVMWERNLAIEQLHELGYEFGQKIEPTTTEAEIRSKYHVRVCEDICQL